MLTQEEMASRRLDMQVQRPATAMVILLGLFAFFLLITPVFTALLTKVCHNAQGAVRISMVVQDVLVFIVPPIATALLSTRLPARLLGVDRGTGAGVLLLSVLALVCSIPAMNAIVAWNESWHLPESMVGIETSLREMEEAARNVTDMLMAGASVPSLIVSVLIVGCLAGFGEELFFRGGMQRLLMMGRSMNPHVAIWATAVVFSILHFQVFGFVPRVLLGAFFGYLFWWSGSLWLPIALHAFNNSLVVVVTWLSVNHGTGAAIDKIGTDASSGAEITAVVLSIAATAGLIMLIRRESLRRSNLRKGFQA